MSDPTDGAQLRRPRRAAREARAPARGRGRAVPARLPGPGRDRRRSARPTRASAPARRPRTRYRVAGRLVARRGPRQGRLPRPASTAAARSSCTPARTCSGAERQARSCRPRPRRHRRRRGHRVRDPRAASSRCAVDGWKLLAKSLRPPPDKFHGLEDTETRYRHRELDLIANAESPRSSFASRAAVVTAIRRWLDERGFVEVETPVLQPLYGGALARPFTTHHNALDRDLYLRIATELYLKRLIVGGIDRVYELGKDFRNEGVSYKHNPEFTMLEWYEAYADYDDAAERLEQLVAVVAERVIGTTKVERDGRRDRPRAALAADHAARGDPRADRHRHRRAPDARGARRGDGLASPTRGGLGQARRRAALQGGRAEPDPADLRPRLPGRDVPVRQAPPLRGGAGRALGGLRRRFRDRQRLHRAQRPRRAAPALRGSRPRSCAAATRRRSPTTRPSSRRSSRGCRRPAASGLGIDRLVMLLTGAKTCARSCCSPRCATERMARCRSADRRWPSAQARPTSSFGVTRTRADRSLSLADSLGSRVTIGRGLVAATCGASLGLRASRASMPSW